MNDLIDIFSEKKLESRRSLKGQESENQGTNFGKTKPLFYS